MSERFKPFNNEELAVLGTGLALAGGLAGMQAEAGPILGEVNEEMDKPERKNPIE